MNYLMAADKNSLNFFRVTPVELAEFQLQSSTSKFNSLKFLAEIDPLLPKMLGFYIE